jgi:HK97 gp10 family phage protein
VVVEIRYNHIPKMKAQAPGLIKAVVLKAATEFETLVKTSMQGGKSGAVYGRHQASAPGEPPAIDTGNLINSIRHEAEDGGFTQVISANAEYAQHLEYGTRKMAPRPYMRPAAEKIRPRFLEAMRQAIERWTP